MVGKIILVIVLVVFAILAAIGIGLLIFILGGLIDEDFDRIEHTPQRKNHKQNGTL